MENLINEFEQSEFWNLIGLKFQKIKKGNVILKLPIKKSLYNTQQSVHGGVYATILDITMGITTRTINHEQATTLEMAVHFLKSANKGVIYSKGFILHQGRATMLARAELYNEKGELLAHSTGTFRMK